VTAGTNVPSIQLTSVGFLAPQPASVLAGVQLDIDAAFGRNLNYGFTTSQGQLASSWGATIVNANSIFVYFSQQTDPARNSGRWQDAVARIYFLEREPSAPTALQIACNGAQGTPIPLGALVVDPSNNQYQCVQAGTIPAGGTVTLAFAAVLPGPTPVPQTVKIVQVLAGWDSAAVVTGAVGRNVEGTAAFEARRADTVAGNSFGPIGAIIGAVAKVSSVLDYYGFSNNSAGPVTINGVTIPAYSIYVAVAGGAPQAVADAIWSKKGAGAPMFGNTTLTVYDSNPLYSAPVPYQITYEIPPALQVLFKVVIANGPLVPSSAATQVQSALIAAFSGQTLAADFVGSVAGTILTVSTLNSGTISVGQVVSDLTGNLAANTTVTALGSGTGGVGTYTVSPSQTVASEPMTSEVPPSAPTVPRARINSLLYAIQYVPAIAALGSWAQVASITIGSANSPDASVFGHVAAGVLTVTTVVSGTVVLGDFVSDLTGLLANGTFITSFGTGTGGTGTYNVNNPQSVGATFTGTGTGTSLAASAVTGAIAVGQLVVGAGVPANTTIVSGPAGGGAGTYVTSNATTSSGAALSSNEAMSCSSAGLDALQVNANQVPQLTAPNILVTTT
jgi:hypothetical protein